MVHIHIEIGEICSQMILHLILVMMMKKEVKERKVGAKKGQDNICKED